MTYTHSGMMRVFAMARPKRPMSERAAVRAAAGANGSVALRARKLAASVATATMVEVDRAPDEQFLSLLLSIEPTPIHTLATHPEIDTASLIRDERMRKLEARGGRRLPERDWPGEDREVLRAVQQTLARRYALLLR